MQQLLTGRKRFPEFAESTDRQPGQFGTVPKDWTVVHIGDIASEVGTRGAVDGSVVYSCTKHDGLVPSLEYFGKQVFSRNLESYKRLQAGDFAYATNHIEEGSIGLLREGQSPGLVSPMYTVFRPNDRVNPEFLFALLKTESYRRVFETRMSASVDRRGSLRWHEFSRIKIGLPSVAEQDRIAEVLRLVDLEIDQLARLHELIEAQRRALLSRLLSGSLTVP
jgi:type I restriction enzyme S subunit